MHCWFFLWLHHLILLDKEHAGLDLSLGAEFCSVPVLFTLNAACWGLALCLGRTVGESVSCLLAVLAHCFIFHVKVVELGTIFLYQVDSDLSVSVVHSLFNFIHRTAANVAKNICSSTLCSNCKDCHTTPSLHDEDLSCCFF